MSMFFLQTVLRISDASGNSKNYGDNWISAGYGLWFLRESRYLNGARSRIGSSCGVSGTGFLFSQAVLDAQGGGWPFHLLTEDIEFTIDNVTRGMGLYYCYLTFSKRKDAYYHEQMDRNSGQHR